MNRNALKRSCDLLLGCSRPLLVTHIAPDGDAVGSLLGLGWALRALDISPTLACQDSLPRRFDFLPGFDEVTSRPTDQFDLVVSLDCSDADRLGTIGSLPAIQGLPLLNIDHHLTNVEFGTVDLVDAGAVSTTHVLYHLIRHMKVPLDERIASCLLTGLVTDTRGFRTSNVTAEVLQVAVEFVEMGAALPVIARNGLDRRPLSALRLWGEALSRLRFKDGVVWAALPLEAQQAANHEGQGSAGLTSLLIGAEEASVSAVLMERSDGQVEVSFRAVPGFDVAQVALTLGGGGHALAAGCLIPGPLEEAERQVLEMLHQSLNRQRGARPGDDRRHTESE